MKKTDAEFVRDVAAKVERESGVRPNKVRVVGRRDIVIETFIDSIEAGGKEVYFKSRKRKVAWII